MEILIVEDKGYEGECNIDLHLMVIKLSLRHRDLIKRLFFKITAIVSENALI